MIGMWLCAARGNLDTLNMDFNKLNNEIKKLRIVRKCDTDVLQSGFE
jgi:hypothetical protein